MDIKVYSQTEIINGERQKSDYHMVGIIDTYDSLIWTDRYAKAGDFELCGAVNGEPLWNKVDWYGSILMIDESEHAMLVEKVLVESSPEKGLVYNMTGRSIEVLLAKRIVWGTIQYKDNLSNVVDAIIQNNFIEPENANRKVECFAYEATDDEHISAISVEKQYTGDDFYSIISGLCTENDVGMMMRFNPDELIFTFNLYWGKNRSESQFSNPYVTFATEFENLSSSNFYDDKSGYKNIAYVGGEESGTKKTTVTVFEGDEEPSGFERSEVYVNASGISRETQVTIGRKTLTKTMSVAEYKEALKAEGKKNIGVMSIQSVVEGEVSTTGLYNYGADYFMGDIVMIHDDASNKNVIVRITEMVFSYNQSGYTVYPTLDKLTDDEIAKITEESEEAT